MATGMHPAPAIQVLHHHAHNHLFTLLIDCWKTPAIGHGSWRSSRSKRFKSMDDMVQRSCWMLVPRNVIRDCARVKICSCEGYDTLKAILGNTQDAYHPPAGHLESCSPNYDSRLCKSKDLLLRGLRYPERGNEKLS